MVGTKVRTDVHTNSTWNINTNQESISIVLLHKAGLVPTLYSCCLSVRLCVPSQHKRMQKSQTGQSAEISAELVRKVHTSVRHGIASLSFSSFRTVAQSFRMITKISEYWQTIHIVKHDLVDDSWTIPFVYDVHIHTMDPSLECTSFPHYALRCPAQREATKLEPMQISPDCVSAIRT
jgi:hypothetical protein